MEVGFSYEQLMMILSSLLFINQSESMKSADDVSSQPANEEKNSEMKTECICCYNITTRSQIQSTLFDIVAH